MFGSHLITLVAKAQKPAAKLLACEDSGGAVKGEGGGERGGEAMRPIWMLRTPPPT